MERDHDIVLDQLLTSEQSTVNPFCGRNCLSGFVI